MYTWTFDEKEIMAIVKCHDEALIPPPDDDGMWVPSWPVVKILMAIGITITDFHIDSSPFGDLHYIYFAAEQDFVTAKIALTD